MCFCCRPQIQDAVIASNWNPSGGINHADTTEEGALHVKVCPGAVCDTDHHRGPVYPLPSGSDCREFPIHFVSQGIWTGLFVCILLEN